MTNRQDPFSPTALLLAPLAVVPAAALHLALWHWDASKAVGALYASFLTVPLSYGLTFFLGVPYLFGMRRLGLLTAGSTIGGALFAGLTLGFLVGVSLFPLWDWYGRLFYLSLGGMCGASVGLAYWAIWKLAGRFRGPR